MNESRLSVPLAFESRTDRVMTFSFAGLTRALEVTLTHEIGIHAMHGSEWWDALIFFEASPMKKPEGYICEDCLPEHAVLYPSRKDLWVDHMFEPFLVWVNETLSGMHWLSLSQTDCGGGRWADLHAEWFPPDAHRHAMIALRQ